MKKCKMCKREPGMARRINNEGLWFCSDDCYEEFDQSPNDHDHPYIDDYESVRFEYLGWMNGWERDLYKGYWSGTPRKADLLESIDEMIGEFWDYCGLEGSDGCFSSEIYRYLLELEDLKGSIAAWKPDEKMAEEWR
ncbi:hypothetical protein ACQCVE_17065 [Metabacillus sp. 113a]|uniref:hypothetical protein n=1 Tax=Metabacillus sp. 113a TaxID=3404706 RepID=UPI003CF156CD